MVEVTPRPSQGLPLGWSGHAFQIEWPFLREANTAGFIGIPPAQQVGRASRMPWAISQRTVAHRLSAAKTKPPLKG